MVALLGPTASGKTELAMEVARRRGAEILSVDSMQVYRKMDIGTAKPSVQERAEVRHHLVDVAEAHEEFSAARFVEIADRVIADAAARGAPLLLTGGTPLYLKALFQGLFAGPGADAQIRRELREVALAELHRQLATVDPEAAARIHPNDGKRLVRALEVYRLTGRPISEWQTQWQAPAVRHNATWVGLAWERDELNRRINARVKDMIDRGWVEEVRRLLQSGQGLSATAMAATGYAQIIRHLEGKLSLSDAIEEIKIATRQLARRQVKWMRRFEGVLWIDGRRPLEEKVDQILGCWMAM